MGTKLDAIRGDVQFEGFRWLDEFRDLILFLRLPAQPGQAAAVSEVCCRRANDLEVTMDWRGQAANALSWDIEWKVAQGGRWSVRLDYAPHGVIQLTCDEVVVDGKVVWEVP